MRFFAEVALDARADRSISSCSQARLSIVANSFGLLMGGRIGLLQRDRLRALMDHLGLRDNAVPAMQHSPFMPGAVRERGLFRRSFAELPRLRRLDVRSNRIARLTDWGVRVPSLEKPDLRWKPCELSPWPLTELDQRELRRPDLSGLPPHTHEGPPAPEPLSGSKTARAPNRSPPSSASAAPRCTACVVRALEQPSTRGDPASACPAWTASRTHAASSSPAALPASLRCTIGGIPKIN